MSWTVNKLGEHVFSLDGVIYGGVDKAEFTEKWLAFGLSDDAGAIVVHPTVEGFSPLRNLEGPERIVSYITLNEAKQVVEKNAYRVESLNSGRSKN